MNVRILGSAEHHLIEGSRFHEEQAAGLGTYFLNAPFADIDSLALYGGIHPVVFGYHRSVAKRFPFAIYYLVTGDEVRVYAVLDCRRRPSWVRSQLKQV